MRSVMIGVIAMTYLAGLMGCGGSSGSSRSGGTNSPPAPVLIEARFVDAPAEGLEYETSSVSGITDESGGFMYAAGETVAFSLGAVAIGEASGASIITPLDLIENSTSQDERVLNIVRFLLLLDQDVESNNGIQISSAMLDASQDWDTVDLALPDLDITLSPILSSVESVLERPVIVPTAGEAQAHIEASIACLASGVYGGRFDGDDRGPFLLWVQSQRFDPLSFGDLEPRVGVTSALAYSESEDFVIGVAPRQGLQFNNTHAFISGSTTTGSEFVGNLFDYAEITNGVWQNDQFGESGNFSGGRLGGALDAQHRLSGFFSVSEIITPDSTGVVALDVFANGTVTGFAQNLRSDVQIELEGTLEEGVISVADGTSTWTLAFDADGTDADNDLELGDTAGFLGNIDGGTFDQANVIGTSCRLN